MDKPSVIELKKPRVADVIKALKKMPRHAPVFSDDGTGWLTDKLIIRFDMCVDDGVEIIGKS